MRDGVGDEVDHVLQPRAQLPQVRGTAVVKATVHAGLPVAVAIFPDRRTAPRVRLHEIELSPEVANSVLDCGSSRCHPTTGHFAEPGSSICRVVERYDHGPDPFILDDEATLRAGVCFLLCRKCSIGHRV